MMLLSSITLYDVIWGTVIPVFSCLCFCLVMVFHRELWYFLKNKKSVWDFFRYLMMCSCWLPHAPIDPTVRMKLEVPKKDGENSENGKKKEASGNLKDAPLENVVSTK